jgi:hypothetical protein
VAAAEVAKYNQWTLNEMRDRQAKLAKRVAAAADHLAFFGQGRLLGDIV